MNHSLLQGLPFLRTNPPHGLIHALLLAALLLPLLSPPPAAAQEFGGALTTWSTQWWAPPGAGVQAWVASSPERSLRLRGTVGGEWGGRTSERSFCTWYGEPCVSEEVRARTSILLADLTVQVVGPPISGIRLGLGAGLGARRLDHKREGLETGRVHRPENADGNLRPAFHLSGHAERQLAGGLRLELGIHRTRIVTFECPADASCLGSGAGLTRFVLGVGLPR